MRVLAVVLLLLPAPLVAQEETAENTVLRTLELPAHRALQSVIQDPATVLLPFETDGCSGGMSWSWRLVSDLFPDFKDAQGATPPWEDCCVIHDRAYHNAGGTTDASESYAARLGADEALRQCVVRQGEQNVAALSAQYEVSQEVVRQAYTTIGDAMFNAVRFGGGPCSVLPWRWGYGYPVCLGIF